MIQAHITNLKAKLSSYLQQVLTLNQEIIIKKHNKPIAVIIPYSQYQSTTKTKKSTKKATSSFQEFKGVLKDKKIDLEKIKEEFVMKKYL